MSPTPSPDDLLTRQRRAILLHQLADATNGELPLKKATTIPKWAKAQLGLTPEMATAVLDLLIAEQLVAGVILLEMAAKVGRSAKARYG